MIPCSISEGYVTKYTAVMLFVRDAKSLKDRRTLAWRALRSVPFRGTMNAMIDWLRNCDIPMRCKLRELAIAPRKLWRFLSGRADEAAILQWRSTR